MMRWNCLVALVVIAFAGAPAQGRSQEFVEAPPNSRAIATAITVLAAPGHDEAAVRGLAANGAPLQSFNIGDETFSLVRGTGSMPKAAFGAVGGRGVAYLLPIPASSVGLGADLPDEQATYALVTASGTKIVLWRIYRALPSDDMTRKNMIAALARLTTPIATIDPAAPSPTTPAVAPTL